MRIVIAAPPKTGNSWLRCLFAAAYDLQWLRDAPDGAQPAALAAWAAAGRFPDGSLFHRHYDHSPELVAVAAQIPAHLATILRDPYDMFVSLYFFVQAQAQPDDGATPRATDREAGAMVGKPLDHPDVLAFLADGFAKSLRKGIDWLDSGQSVVLRYEALHADPVAELTRATAQIAPLPPEKIAAAIAACQADTLLKSRRGLAKRIRTATVGDWRNHLTDPHLAIFRDRHAAAIRHLGYDVH